MKPAIVCGSVKAVCAGKGWFGLLCQHCRKAGDKVRIRRAVRRTGKVALRKVGE